MNNTIFSDEEEFTEPFVNDYSHRYEIKIGMIYYYAHESKCANCLQSIILPYPVTGIWKHRDAGYDKNSCISPVPAPEFFLLELENNPRMNPGGYRQNNAKRICKKHSVYWDVLINEFLDVHSKSKPGWLSEGFDSHYLRDDYKTACGISIAYNKRNKIFTSKKEPVEPKRYPFKNGTCEKCWHYYKKLNNAIS